MSRYVCVLVVCAIAAGCGESNTAPLAPASSAGVSSVTAGGGTAANAKKKPAPQVQLQGSVSALTGTASAFEFMVGTRRVTGAASTEFKGGAAPSFARLLDGAKVHVSGANKGAYVEAARVTFQDEEAPVVETRVSGSISAITGSAPALTLTIGAYTVTTTSATLVRRKNETLTLAALAVAQKVEVTGEAGAGGVIDAFRIQITGEPPVKPAPFQAKGAVSAVTGTCPIVTFAIEGRTVTTAASTKFVQITCATLTNGRNVQVNGTTVNGVSTAMNIKKRK